MGLIIAVSRYVLPFVAVVVVTKCMLSLILGHPKDKVYGCLIDTDDYTQYNITMLETSIGRSAAQDIRIDNPTISKSHAVISRRLDSWHIYDLNSSWGIVVNGQKIKDSAVIKDGDTITLGGSSFDFSVLDDPVTVVGNKRKKKTNAQEYTQRTQNTQYGQYTQGTQSRQGTQSTQGQNAYSARAYYAKRYTFKNRGTGALYELSGNHVTIGRGPANDIKLFSADASRHHADLVLYENGWAISDAGSKNGTKLNGQLIDSAKILFDGDVVDLGGEKFIFGETSY